MEIFSTTGAKTNPIHNTGCVSDSYVIGTKPPFTSQLYPFSYPAAVVLQQVQLDSLHTAIVTACVDLKHKMTGWVQIFNTSDINKH